MDAKGRRFYEWSLIVPNRTRPENPHLPLSPDVSTNQFAKCDAADDHQLDVAETISRSRRFEAKRNSTCSPCRHGRAFPPRVAPEGVTYESVLQLAASIRQSTAAQ